MKKVFAILAVAGVMAACNSGENKDAAADTTKTDTTVVAPVVVDTTVHTDTAAHTATDTVKTK